MSALREALGNLPDAVFADVLESEEAYLLVLDLPGVTAETLDVSVEAGRVVIEGQRSKDVPLEFRFVREDRSVFLDVELPLPPDATGQALREPSTGASSNSRCRRPQPPPAPQSPSKRPDSDCCSDARVRADRQTARAENELRRLLYE